MPVTVTVANDNDTLVVTTSRLDDTLFEQYVLALRAVPGRHWDTERKANIVPVRSERALGGAQEVSAERRGGRRRAGVGRRVSAVLPGA